MVDVTEISAVFAAASVLGVICHILDIRNQTKMRQTDSESRMNPVFNLNGIELVQAMRKITALEYKDYDDLVKKYGTIFTETRITVAIAAIPNYFEALEHILRRKLESVSARAPRGFFGILSVACAVLAWLFVPALSLAAIFIGFYALTRKNKIDSVLGIVGIVTGFASLMHVSYIQNLDYGPAPNNLAR